MSRKKVSSKSSIPQRNIYEITMTVKAIPGRCYHHKLGDKLVYRNDQIYTDPKVGFCFWALQSFASILPALAREVTSTDRDWLPRITEQTCPDPKGEVKFAITRKRIT